MELAPASAACGRLDKFPGKMRSIHSSSSTKSSGKILRAHMPRWILKAGICTAIRFQKIADHSDFTELEVAGAALTLAQQAGQRAYADPRVAVRESHVGYYLIDKGAGLLHQRAHFRPPLGPRIQAQLRKHPDEFFLLGIQMMSVGIMAAMVLFLTDPGSSALVILFSMFILLLPSSHSAVQLMNHLVTSILPPKFCQNSI